jgi:hypothetical protein
MKDSVGARALGGRDWQQTEFSEIEDRRRHLMATDCNMPREPVGAVTYLRCGRHGDLHKTQLPALHLHCPSARVPNAGD